MSVPNGSGFSERPVDVSIIVPVYNPPLDFLDKFLNSVQNQTLETFELIIVDDASPGDAPEILDHWATKDNRITVIHRKENGRAGAARGDGLDVACGEFVLFADCDDLLDAEMCRKLVALGREHNADIIACSWNIVTAGIKCCGKVKLPDKVYQLSSPEEQARAVPHVHHALWNKLFRRTTIGDIRFAKYQVNIGEDRLFNMECFARSRTMVTSSYRGYSYILHQGSATGRSVKGVPYLQVLLDSERDVLIALSNAGMGSVVRAYGWIWFLRVFSVGCLWIADEASESSREDMWGFWVAAFNQHVQSVDNTNPILILWYRTLIMSKNPRLIWYGSWLVSKYVSKVTELMAWRYSN